MKNLSDYIKKSCTNNYRNTDVIIENELQLHFYAEFVVGDCTYERIYEKYGSYLGQKELVLDLAKKINKIVMFQDSSTRYMCKLHPLLADCFVNKCKC